MTDEEQTNKKKLKFTGAMIGALAGAGVEMLLGHIAFGAGVGFCCGWIFDKTKKQDTN